MNWFYYLLEANLYLAVFYGLYRLLLHQETFYNLNRYYLITATILSFLIPFLQIGYLHSLVTEAGTAPEKPSLQALNQPDATWEAILYYGLLTAKYAYSAMAIWLSWKFLKGLSAILSLIWKAPKEKIGRIVKVEIRDPEIAFSFFNFLFLNPQAREQKMIVEHELVHIRQKHSIDIMLFELLLIINWFNPVVWLLKKDIQLVHEYIADAGTTANQVKKHDYAMFLIQHSCGLVPSPLANQLFNQSILKMRINMLNKEKSAGSTRFRYLLAFPVIAGMLCSSSMAFTKDYATMDLYASKAGPSASLPQDSLKKKTMVKKLTVTVQAPPPPPAPPKAPVHKISDPKIEVIKFAPPKINKGKSSDKTAPKAAKIKFAPPIVKKDEMKGTEAPPPPPVEPSTFQNL